MCVEFWSVIKCWIAIVVRFQFDIKMRIFRILPFMGKANHINLQVWSFFCISFSSLSLSFDHNSFIFSIIITIFKSVCISHLNVKAEQWSEPSQLKYPSKQDEPFFCEICCTYLLLFSSLVAAKTYDNNKW